MGKKSNKRDFVEAKNAASSAVNAAPPRRGAPPAEEERKSEQSAADTAAAHDLTAAAAKEAAVRALVDADFARRIPPEADCGICCKPYEDIAAASDATTSGAVTAVLPCCHTVCRACVFKCQERHSVACPICGTRFAAITTAAHVDALPRNPFVEDALQTSVQCIECMAAGLDPDERSRATMSCTTKDCDTIRCVAHAGFHGRTPQTRGHIMAPSTPYARAATMADICTTHGKHLDTYCLNCCVLICLACTLRGGLHSSADPAHHSVLLSEQLPKIKEILADAKKKAERRQSDSVNQLVVIRQTETAADKRQAALISEVEHAFNLMTQILLNRKATIVDEIVALTRTKRASLEEAAAAEQLHWMTIQGGVWLTEQLLAAKSTTPTRVGQLSNLARVHLEAAALKELAPAPALEKIAFVVEPTVQKVLEAVGTLRHLHAYGPACTVSGEGLTSAVPGKETSVVVTAKRITNERLQAGGDCVEAKLTAFDDPDRADKATSAADCTVRDSGDGTYVVTYCATAFGRHLLNIIMNGEPLAGCPFNVNVTVTAGGKIFSWGGHAQYDNRGILYHLATEGGTRPWTNPDQTGVVAVTGSEGRVTGNLRDFVKNKAGQLYVGNLPGVWLAVDLKGKQVVLSGYMLSFYAGGNQGLQAPRSWNIEGSNDGTTWSVLKAHTMDRTFSITTITAYWPVSILHENSAFSKFRVVLTGKDSSNADYLFCSGIDLYGELLTKELAM